METLRLRDVVTENGLVLKTPELMQYINREVSINIIPIDNDKEAKRKRLLSFCGLFDDDDVKLIEEMKEEQRQLTKRDKNVDFS
jgi:hypothetical protein